MSDIAELFSMDPLKLTSGDFPEEYLAKHGLRPIDAIIKRYREARAQFNLGEKQAGSTKKVAKSNGEKITKLDLDELLG